MKVFLVLVIFERVSHHASGVLVTTEGMVPSVQLACQVSGLPKHTKVVWSRFDLNPSTVHQHQNKDYDQNQQYSNRTSMSADALKTGDLSLTLREPVYSDSGIYTCTVYNDRNEITRIIAPLQVVAVEGTESVQLPCWVSGSPEDTKVVWSRLDLNPTTVHQHQEKFEPYLQNQKYSNRTSMLADALKTGFFSLTLNKLHHSDSGVYTCTIYNNENEMRRRFVVLRVAELPTLPPQFFLFLAISVAFGLAAYCWYKTITVSQVEVEEGAWLVKLPYRTIVPLPPCVTVEWSRCAPEPMKVHQFQNGINNDLVMQDEFYSDRTQMERDPLRTGDLSLTLRDPCDRDSGTYICTVYKDGEVWTQKVVRLQVKVVLKEVEVQEGAQSVTLPFRTRTRLPGDATVEWTRFGLEHMKVHVYQSGRDHPEKQNRSYRGRTKINKKTLKTGDFSLTINNPTQADSSLYLCTVHKDKELVWSRMIPLHVKAQGF